MAEPDKFDYAVAKHLKDNLPNKEAMFMGIKKVNYFVGSKAVDLLMESKWANKEHKDYKFKDRREIVIYLNDLLLKKFYHRSKKIVKITDGRRKFKLDMHDIQQFEDSNEPYVWLYEPTSMKAWLLCIGVIFAGFAICLFPLWPSFLRTGVYYVCVAGLVFLTSIIGLAVVRQIIFFILWVLTFGRLRFWILPNLTEDVGFLESFWPLYAVEEAASSASGEEAGGTNSGSSGGGGSGIKED